MKALERGLLPRGLLCALCALSALSALAGAGPAVVSIPPELRSAVLKVTVNSTPCSVTCGPGHRVEELCEVTLAGQRRNCSLQRSLCLGSRTCGLRHVAVPAGRPLRLGCLGEDGSSGFGDTYGYAWRWAPGLITTNDLLFQPLENARAALSLSPATEADAGTYRCDVRVRGTFTLVKRIYFGLKVIPSRLVDLSFQKSLSREQKLAEGSAGNGSREGRERFWEKGAFYEAVLGVGSGVMGGLLVGLVLCCCRRLWRRRRGAEI